MKTDGPLAKELNVWNGKVTNKFVAESLFLEYARFEPEETSILSKE